MNRVIKSTFALSLFLLTLQVFAQTEAIDTFTDLEEELLPELKGPQGFTSPDFHQQKDWRVKEKAVIIDKEPLKGQQHSIIPWKTLDPQEFLSIQTWMKERAVKDKVPDWKIRLRDERHSELYGKLISCFGTCTVFRGTTGVLAQHLSRILEGDEVTTGRNSEAWIYLMDGTLVRLGGESSVSFLEFNIAPHEIFLQARLNQGHVFWHPRLKSELKMNLDPETSVSGLPLLIREANQEFFERKFFQSQNDAAHLNQWIDLDENAIGAQFRSINLLKNEQNPLTKPTRVMLVAPNVTVGSSQLSFDLLHLPGGASYFKKRHEEEGSSVSLQLRGYNNTDTYEIGTDQWFEIETNGRTLAQMEKTPGDLQVLELLTRRIKTYELARELWFKEFTAPIHQSLPDAKKLAVDHGYRLWGAELSDRLHYLSEYTRRIETTNLQSQANLFTRLEDKGEKINRELSAEIYQYAVNQYLKGLKTRYTNKKMQVREMNDLQYYVWILKNGKL